MTTAADAPVPARVGWRPYQIYVLILLTAITVLNYLDRGVLAVLQEPIKHELKLSDWQLGLLTGPAFALFYAVAGVPSARLAERFNRSMLMSVSLGVWSVATAACGAAMNFFHMALCRLGVGIGEGGTIPISYSLLAESFSPKQRGLVMSIVSAGNPISGIITPLIVPLAAATLGWRAAFVVVGLPGLAVAILIRMTLKEPREAPDAPPRTQKLESFWTDAKYLFGNRAFLFLFLGAIFTGIGISANNAFRYSFLVRTQHISLGQAGAILAVAAPVGLIGSFLGGWLADHFADSRGRSYLIVPGTSGIVTFVLYAIAFSLHNFWAVAAMFVVATFTYNIKDGPNYAAVQNVALSRMRATAAALYMLGATAVGGGAGPVVTGAISDYVAGRSFHGPASFALSCPGGRAAAGAAHGLAQACAASSAHGIQIAMIIVSAAFALGGGLQMLGVPTIRYAEEPLAA